MTPWWEARREGEPTADYLARVLAELGLPKLAAKASLKHYDDYFCPPEVDDGMNIHHLVADLQNALPGMHPVGRRERTKQVIEAAKNGTFDGTKEEARAWEESAEGKAAMAELLDES